MKSEKVKEIKECLKFNAQCGVVYGKGLVYSVDNKYKTMAFADILTYVNELESENEALKNDLLNKDFTCFVGEQHKTDHCPYLEETQNASKETAEKIFNELWYAIKNHCGYEEILDKVDLKYYAKQFGVNLLENQS